MATTISIVRLLLIKEEGIIDHMYLDTKGLVTVGVGYLLASVNDAYGLSWRVKSDGSVPTKETIKKEYDKVASCTKGYLAQYYKQFTKLYVTEFVIGELLDARILEKQQQLKKHFKFDSYPDLVQEVLIDMAFNFGVSKIVNGFPTFTKHIIARDWLKASKECRSSQISEHRNIGRATKLSQAAAKEKEANKLNL